MEFIYFILVIWAIITIIQYPVILLYALIALVVLIAIAGLSSKDTSTSYASSRMKCHNCGLFMGQGSLWCPHCKESQVKAYRRKAIPTHTPPRTYPSCVNSAHTARSASVPDGVVYMLKAGPHYKVGKSVNPDKRIKQLKIQLPYPIEVVHKIHTKDISKTERYWHKRFSGKRENGEWFALNEQEVAEFKSKSSM